MDCIRAVVSELLDERSATAGGDVSAVETAPRTSTEATGPAASTPQTDVTPTGGGCTYLVSNSSLHVKLWGKGRLAASWSALVLRGRVSTWSRGQVNRGHKWSDPLPDHSMYYLRSDPNFKVNKCSNHTTYMGRL